MSAPERESDPLRKIFVDVKLMPSNEQRKVGNQEIRTNFTLNKENFGELRGGAFDPSRPPLPSPLRVTVRTRAAMSSSAD
jgi:hypothetical protein